VARDATFPANALFESIMFVYPLLLTLVLTPVILHFILTKARLISATAGAVATVAVLSFGTGGRGLIIAAAFQPALLELLGLLSRAVAAAPVLALIMGYLTQQDRSTMRLMPVGRPVRGTR
jgi:hypothetical protein